MADRTDREVHVAPQEPYEYRCVHAELTIGIDDVCTIAAGPGGLDRFGKPVSPSEETTITSRTPRRPAGRSRSLLA